MHPREMVSGRYYYLYYQIPRERLSSTMRPMLLIVKVDEALLHPHTATAVFLRYLSSGGAYNEISEQLSNNGTIHMTKSLATRLDEDFLHHARDTLLGYDDIFQSIVIPLNTSIDISKFIKYCEAT
jgi:hypothetical protein